MLVVKILTVSMIFCFLAVGFTACFDDPKPKDPIPKEPVPEEIIPEEPIESDLEIHDMIKIENEYAERKKAPVTLTHKKHAEEYGIACADCHHVYKDGENIFEEGDSVQKCSECHNAQKSEGKVKKLMLAYHKNCMGCHKELKKQAKETGPTTCSGCHLTKSE